FHVHATAVGHGPGDADQTVQPAPARVSTTLTLPRMAIVRGQATTDGTTPVPGATVRIDPGFTATTDGQGNYLATVPAGTYQVSAKAPAHDDAAPTSTTVAIGGSSTVNLVLPVTPIIELLDAGGAVTTTVRFGVFDNAYNAAGDLLKSVVEAD